MSLGIEGGAKVANGWAREVIVMPYDSAWDRMAAAEAGMIRNALGEALLDVKHIGSTSVPGLSAKPILDFLGIVRDLSVLDARAEALEMLGYMAMGENGLPGRRFFKKGESPRTHHLHFYQRDNVREIERHLALPAYLRAYQAEAEAYGALKTKLAAVFPQDIEAYMAGKSAFVRELELRALLWRKANGTDYRI